MTTAKRTSKGAPTVRRMVSILTVAVAVAGALATTASPAVAATAAFTRTDIQVGANPRSIAVGDFNRDGKPDLAVANYGSDTVSIRLGDGAGRFTAAPDLPIIGGHNGVLSRLSALRGGGRLQQRLQA